MKLIDKIYDFLFEETVILKTNEQLDLEELDLRAEKPAYISCCDLFLKN